MGRPPTAWLCRENSAGGQMGGRQVAMRPARRSCSSVTVSLCASGCSGVQRHITGQRSSSRKRVLAGTLSRNANIRCTSPSVSRFSRESKGISRSSGSSSGASRRSASSPGRSIRISAVLRHPTTKRLGRLRLDSFIRFRATSHSFWISPA